ncbi:MAG: tRNA (adenosine(37)-N6)-threonylcarbamoyltransferase complex ATPase subunit type 1 TsaE [Eubacteriales bacterium]|nr:tRNA (adenosine(37)-N6)-threonylcarbamoyltransferase complex ATPase subunit type 1 TsaE [Eubacteriales bacterium]
MRSDHHIPGADPLQAADMICLISRSPLATETLGYRLGQLLMPDSVISLEGDLGAGKTTLVRGLAAGIGSEDPVSSPTFTLLIEHERTSRGLALYHFDVYRLAASDDPDLASDQFMAAGLDEYFDAGGISVIEWGGLIEVLLPLRTLHIRMTLSAAGASDERRIELKRTADQVWPDGLAAVLLGLTTQGLMSFCTEPCDCAASADEREGKPSC